MNISKPLSTKLKTLIVGCGLTDHWFDILLNLNDENKGCLDIIHWVYSVPFSQRDQVTERQSQFPNTFFAIAMDAIKAIPSKSVHAECLDEELLKVFVEHEPIVMSMLDRMDPGGCFTYAERRRHYTRLLKYWIAIIDQDQPDLIMFSQAPHMGYDYVIYMIAKHRKIRTMISNVNSALGRVVLAQEIEGIQARVLESYKSQCENKDELLSLEEEKVISNHIDKLQQHYDVAKPHYMKMLEERNETLSINAQNLFIKMIKIVYWKYKKMVPKLVTIFNKPSTPPENYLKKPGIAMEAAGYDAKEWFEQKKHERAFKRMLREQYESLAITEIDSTKNSVYIPLHYQPETTTCPEGGYFNDQQMMVEMFSVLLPDDWVIYVKEHYLQLQENASKGHHCRDYQYYLDLAAMPKVKLVSLGVNSFDLIDASSLVGTVLGYAAWEAMVRGKPAFLFGRPWFSAFKNAYVIKSKQDFMNAFSDIRDNDQVVNKADIQVYLRAYFKVSFPGFTSMWNREVTDMTYEQNVKNFSHNIRTFLNR